MLSLHPAPARRPVHTSVSKTERVENKEERTVAYEFSCKAAGAEGCNWKARGATEDEVIAKVTQHAQKVHKVKNVSDTIASYARSSLREV